MPTYSNICLRGCTCSTSICPECGVFRHSRNCTSGRLRKRLSCQGAEMLSKCCLCTPSSAIRHCYSAYCSLYTNCAGQSLPDFVTALCVLCMLYILHTMSISATFLHKAMPNNAAHSWSGTLIVRLSRWIKTSSVSLATQEEESSTTASNLATAEQHAGVFQQLNILATLQRRYSLSDFVDHYGCCIE